MSYPIAYDARGLATIVTISDIDDVEVARYEMPQVVVGTPTQDFSLTGVTLNMGINANHGKVDIYIDDRDRNLIETKGGDIFSVFKAGFTVRVFLGKDPTTVNLWVTSVLQDIDLVYETGLFTQHLQCFGYGIRTQQRLSLLKRSQERESDGLTPDQTDTSTSISNLFKDTLTQTSHLAAPGLGQLDITTELVQDININIPEFTKNIVSLGSILTELAAMGFAYYGVNAFKQAFLFRRGQVSSGFLISNDVTTPISVNTSNWNPDKLMFFRNQPVVIHDASSDSAYSILHFVGSQKLFVDYNTQAHDSDLSTGFQFNAFPFFPETDNVAEIALFLSNLIGTITDDLQVTIVGADSAGIKPDSANIRKSIILTKEQLQEEINLTGKFFIIKFDKIPVTHGEKLFVLVPKNTNASSALNISYQSGLGERFISSDGVTWSDPIEGEGAFITYNSKNIRIIGEDTVASQNLLTKEGIVNSPDTPNQTTILLIAQAQLQARSKIVRNYEPVQVSAPTLPPELGKTIRLIDVILGIDTEVDLIGYSLSIDAFADTNRGATTMTVILQEQFT